MRGALAPESRGSGEVAGGEDRDREAARGEEIDRDRKRENMERRRRRGEWRSFLERTG